MPGAHWPTLPQVYAPSRTVVVYAPEEWVDSQSETIPGLGVKGLGPYPEITTGMMVR